MTAMPSFDPPLDVDECAEKLDRARRAFERAETDANQIAYLEARIAFLIATINDRDAKLRDAMRQVIALRGALRRMASDRSSERRAAE